MSRTTRLKKLQKLLSLNETDLDTITTIVTRYYEQDTWKDNLVFEEESFQLLQDILKSAGELTKEAPYEDLVITTHAENAK